MIHWSWLMLPVFICLLSSYIYTRYMIGKVMLIIEDMISTLDNHNKTLEKISQERIQLIDNILDPRLH